MVFLIDLDWFIQVNKQNNIMAFVPVWTVYLRVFKPDCTVSQWLTIIKIKVKKLKNECEIMLYIC